MMPLLPWSRRRTGGGGCEDASPSETEKKVVKQLARFVQGIQAPIPRCRPIIPFRSVFVMETQTKPTGQRARDVQSRTFTFEAASMGLCEARESDYAPHIDEECSAPWPYN